MPQHNSNTGFSLIELIIAVGVFVVLISGVTFMALGSYDGFVGKGNNREVERLSQEAFEIMKIIKEKSWADIADVASKNPSSVMVTKNGTSGEWELTAGTETRGVFTRSIFVYDVERNDSGVIVTDGGFDDPSTKRIVVTISATGRSDLTTEAYLSNWESFRMEQTDWSGDYIDDDVWAEGDTNFVTSTNMSIGATLSIDAL